MSLISRAKGLILAPWKEWDAITTEDVAIPDLYRNYILYLAAIPPFASFISSWLFGFYSRATLTYVHSTFGAGLWRALVQYALSLPAIFLIAFVLSMAAPYFEGETNDRRALTLAAYAYTPAWLAAGFGLVPGLRFLDFLGFWGVYIFYLGATRMLGVPKDNVDVFTVVALAVTMATSALHGRIVHLIAPGLMV